MKLSQSEIRNNAIRFAHDWKDASSEQAEAQSFWIDLFAVFGIKQRSVSSFEEKVKNIKGAYNRIDVFYAGVMLGEHKSKGEDLTKAQSQAFDYVQDLTRNDRTDEIPQYIVLSDFENIVVFDLDSVDSSAPTTSFKTAKLHENIRHLAFLTGQITRPIDPEDPINIKAVSVLGELHDALERGGYKGHELERFLVRILFMLFADDTGIFEQDTIKLIVSESRDDGFGLGGILEQVFQILDAPKKSRPANTPDELKELPYVNGKLFTEHLHTVNFDEQTRQALLDACEFNWSRISPAVFGSLFQSIMASDEGQKKRRQIGAHYTSERDIMKLINSLFLDDLKAELDKTTTKPKLLAFQDKLANLKLLDPACGCGNFLVVAYRELRLLEIEVLRKYHAKKKGEVQQLLNLDQLLKVNVDQMHGIEIEEWPARIAEVAMWLIDHQMNTLAGETFGQPILRLPLKKSAKIHHGNALRTDWNDVLLADQCSFVLGNPPFVGKKEQNAEQKADLKHIWGDVKGSGVLDFVTCWHRTAAKYIMNHDIRVAFVSTNSICQGEQVAIVWNELLRKLRVQIDFAHRTFSWMSEAKGKAHVHVVIIGFSKNDVQPKRIYEYEDESLEPVVRSVNFINAYLWDAADAICSRRMRPLNGAPLMVFGSKIVDDGHFVLNLEERNSLISSCPNSEEYIRPFIGGNELLNGTQRWVLWLKNSPPSLIRSCHDIRNRVELVRSFRAKSKKKPTAELAQIPSLPGEDRQPESDFLLFPKVSSERRPYIPLGFITQDYIANGSSLIVPNANVFHFGILSSSMHNSWMRVVCGRMKSDYQYSNTIVYNNYPWPQSPTEKQTAAVEAAAQAVLDAREQFPDQTLADLYDPLAMPKPLRDAHRTLDRAVDKCYRKNPFDSERARVEHLFTFYQQLVVPLTAPVKKRRVVKSRKK